MSGKNYYKEDEEKEGDDYLDDIQGDKENDTLFEKDDYENELSDETRIDIESDENPLWKPKTEKDKVVDDDDKFKKLLKKKTSTEDEDEFIKKFRKGQPPSDEDYEW